MEAFQPVGSFKLRGLGRACRARVDSGARHLVCSSGGNAGYAVAFAGRVLEVPVTIVVPSTTPHEMRARIRDEGAEVIEHGDSWDDAHAHATDLALDPATGYVHPFDDPEVWAGHSTLVEELADQGPRPGAMVVAVGGGGLLLGVLEGLHRVGWNEVPVLAVETEGAASLAATLAAGELVTLDRIDSLATTLGARRVAPATLEWSYRHEVISWTVSDRQAVDATERFAADHRVLVEPACGAALSAVYERATPLLDRAPVVVVVCGGAGVTPNLLRQWRRNLGDGP